MNNPTIKNIRHKFPFSTPLTAVSS
jgi:hypothetical protein